MLDALSSSGRILSVGTTTLQGPPSSEEAASVRAEANCWHLRHACDQRRTFTLMLSHSQRELMSCCVARCCEMNLGSHSIDVCPPATAKMWPRLHLIALTSWFALASATSICLQSQELEHCSLCSSSQSQTIMASHQVPSSSPQPPEPEVFALKLPEFWSLRLKTLVHRVWVTNS